MVSREMIWSLVATGMFTVLGYLYMDMQTLRRELAGTSATRFTANDGALMRDDITDVTADIDKRIAVIETHIQYLSPPPAVATVRPPAPAARVPSFDPPPSRPEPEDDQNLRRYDLRLPEQRALPEQATSQMPEVQQSLPSLPRQDIQRIAIPDQPSTLR